MDWPASLHFQISSHIGDHGDLEFVVFLGQGRHPDPFHHGVGILQP